MEENTIFSLEEVQEKAVTIPFGLLSQSIRHEGKYGNSLETKPVQIWNLVDDMKNNLNKNEINYVLGDIFIQKRSSAALLNDSDRNAGYNRYNAPISKWKFDKVIAHITIPNITKPGVNAHIALTLNEQGLTIAYGMNVHVCSNFSVMGGSVLRTYTYNGQHGTGWDTIQIFLNLWTKNLEQLFKIQSGIMENMQNTTIKDERTVQKIVGILYQNAIRQAYFRGAETPFDTHSLSQFVQEMLRQRKEEEKIGNVWDLYNWGTSVMKPGIVDIGEISNVSHGYCNFLCNEFGIPVEDIKELV